MFDRESNQTKLSYSESLLSNTFDAISVQLISVSPDWETVQNVSQGNSSSKPDRTGRDRNVAKQSKMLNNSAYSRLGNNFDCCTERYEIVVYCPDVTKLQ